MGKSDECNQAKSDEFNQVKSDEFNQENSNYNFCNENLKSNKNLADNINNRGSEENSEKRRTIETKKLTHITPYLDDRSVGLNCPRGKKANSIKRNKAEKKTSNTKDDVRKSKYKSEVNKFSVCKHENKIREGINGNNNNINNNSLDDNNNNDNNNNNNNNNSLDNNNNNNNNILTNSNNSISNNSSNIEIHSTSSDQLINDFMKYEDNINKFGDSTHKIGAFGANTRKSNCDSSRLLRHVSNYSLELQRYLEYNSEEKLFIIRDSLKKDIFSLITQSREKLNAEEFSCLISSIIRLISGIHALEDCHILDLGSTTEKNMDLCDVIEFNFKILNSHIKKLISDEEKIRKTIDTFIIIKHKLETLLQQNKALLLIGEEIKWKIDGVFDLTPLAGGFFTDTERDHSLSSGTLVCTNYRLLYHIGLLSLSSVEYELNFMPKYELPIAKIMSIIKLRAKSKLKAAEIRTFDFNVLRFGFSVDTQSRDDFIKKIKAMLGGMPENLYCFALKRVENQQKCSFLDSSGWKFFDVQEEFIRQKVDADSKWKISDLNQEFQLCHTYPRYLYFPASLTTDQIFECASYRSNNRLPTLAYYYAKNKATLTRCSQPSVGLNLRRCKEDEFLLTEIGAANPNNKKLLVYDARPQSSAMANITMGYGHEIIQNYPQCKLKFCNIGNIHVMRNSLAKLRSTICSNDLLNENFLISILRSGWLGHQLKIVLVSIEIAKLIHFEGRSILIHCSDGWDRTSQLISLVLLMLDPFYRTLRGFVVLIEHQWLNFGHRFALRHGLSGSSSSDRAPIFQQFIEIVRQFQKRFDFYFEFNESFLMALMDKVYDGMTGTFIYDSLEERVCANLEETTFSAWDFLLSSKYSYNYKNALYKPFPDVLFVNPSGIFTSYWERYYFRYRPDVNFSVDWASYLNKLVLTIKGCDSKIPPELKEKLLSISEHFDFKYS